MANQRGAGFVLSYVSILISSVVGILFTPYMISTLGQIEYGLYQLMYSTIGYIALLDFGLGSTLTRYILKYRAEGNREKAHTVTAMCVKIYCVFGLIAMAAVYAIALNLDVIYKETITAENLVYAQKIFIIMGLTTSISLISHAMTGIQNANEKYIVSKSVYIVRQLSRVVVIVVLFMFQATAMSVVLADLLVTIVLLIYDVLYCKIALKAHLFFKKWDNSLFKSLFSFSAFVFIQILVTQTNIGLDKMILGRYAALTHVALYGVVMQLYSLFNSMGNVVVGVTLPQISNLVFSNASRDAVTECCARYSRYQLHIVAPLIGGFIVLGQDFFKLWAPQYDAFSAYIISLLIIVPLILESVEGTIFNVMKAKNMQATRSFILFGVMFLHVVLSVSLVKVSPVYGPAIGTSVSFIIGNNILSNIYYHKKIGIHIFKYFKLLFSGTLLTLVISVFIGLFINLLPLTGWLGLIVKGTLYVIAYAVIVFLIGLNTTEKQLVKKILRKVV